MRIRDPNVFLKLVLEYDKHPSSTCNIYDNNGVFSSSKTKCVGKQKIIQINFVPPKKFLVVINDITHDNTARLLKASINGILLKDEIVGNVVQYVTDDNNNLEHLLTLPRTTSTKYHANGVLEIDFWDNDAFAFLLRLNNTFDVVRDTSHHVLS